MNIAGFRLSVSLELITMFKKILPGVAGLFLFIVVSPANGAELTGRILDAVTHNPVPFAYLHLEEINRTATAGRDGHFQFQNIPVGTYTLSVHRVGYKTYTVRLLIDDTVTNPIEIRLQPESVRSDEITVTGTREATAGSRLEHASSKIIGDQLRRNLGSTLSETLSHSPGFSERSSGPAPGRPVMRGLGDERVLILQDGERTGDVSSQSADHAVSLDPMGAEEIEIARGPAALAYGSNAIGGIINVVRNQIPTSLPSRLSGTASILGKSVNREGSAALSATVPFGNWATKMDLNGRLGTDYRTPEGTVTNSYIENTHNTIGISRIGDRGYFGASGSAYFSNYGIPPDPNGGHPSGVDIEMRKYQFDVRGERILHNSFFKLVETRYSFVNYHHMELESDGSMGTEFGQLTTNASIKARHNGWAFFEEGTVGLWGESRDYAVAGVRTPDSNLYQASAFIIQEAEFGPLHIELGTRLEAIKARPEEERTSALIGQIRERSFLGLASSASAIYNLADAFYLGSTWMHSFRSPSLEELYSEGPHLASYSFEIGNPDLEPERGHGLELFLRYRTDKLNAEIAGYRNDFQNYLYARDTGETSVSDPSLNNYQFVGEEALFNGVEFSADAAIINHFRLGGSLSYTIAERNVSPEEQEVTGYEQTVRPLPMIPPLQSQVFLRYNRSRWTVSTRLRIAAKQSRLGEFETETDGYTLLDTNLQYRLQKGSSLHTFSLNAQNITNQAYQNHLSRVKEIFPEPGISVSLLYRVYF